MAATFGQFQANLRFSGALAPSPLCQSMSAFASSGNFFVKDLFLNFWWLARHLIPSYWMGNKNIVSFLF